MDPSTVETSVTDIKSTDKKESCSKHLPRLWVGNLDPRLGEFTLLNLVKKFGTLEEFDFLYHRSGPQVGQPRGYAFVTYKEHSSAQRAIASLDGLTAAGRKLAVKWAYEQDEPKFVPKVKPPPPILSISSKLGTEKPQDKVVSKESKISALEAKLKLLEKATDSVDLAPDIGGPSKPSTVIYNYVERKPPTRSGLAYNPYCKSKVIKRYK